MARNWYAYNGIGDPLLASSYNFSPVLPTCVNGWKVCAIYASGSVTPVAPLSANIRSYVSAGMVTGLQQPPPALDLVRYLVMKPC